MLHGAEVVVRLDVHASYGDVPMSPSRLTAATMRCSGHARLPWHQCGRRGSKAWPI